MMKLKFALQLYAQIVFSGSLVERLLCRFPLLPQPLEALL